MKLFKLVVKDKALSDEIRRCASLDDFMSHHFYQAKDLLQLIAAKRLSRDFLKFYLFARKNLVFRGTSHKGYELITKYGNDKTMENSSSDEIFKLQQIGLRPQDIIYASHTLSKAWEFVIAQREKPAILLAYNADKLVCIDGSYTYKLKPDYRSFLQALEAIVFVFL